MKLPAASCRVSKRNSSKFSPALQKPEDFRFYIAEGSNQSSLFEPRPDKVKNYDKPSAEI